MNPGSLLRGALTRLLGRGRSRQTADDAQLALDFAAPQQRAPTGVEAVTWAPEELCNFPVGGGPPGGGGVESQRGRRAADRARADDLLRRLRDFGLRDGAGGIARLRLTRNRTVMVSYRGGELRVHRGYLDAPEPVLRAVVAFVQSRTRRQRAAAQRVVLDYPAAQNQHAGAHGTERRPRPRERTLAEDEPMLRVLTEWHRRYNDRHFGGALGPIEIRVSRRLKSRLGHYTARTADGLPAEIVIGRAHIRRHGWEEALHTLLHEMVHQWQDETGHALDHGRTFRRKAREVGITPAARRAVGRGAEPRAETGRTTLAPRRRAG